MSTKKDKEKKNASLKDSKVIKDNPVEISEEEENNNPVSETENEEKSPEESAGQEKADQAEIISKLTQDIVNLNNQMLRERAEFENYKKRRANEINNLQIVANEDIILSLLPVLDDLDLMIINSRKNQEGSGLLEGAQLIQQKFQDILKRRGLKEVEAEGKKFDPEFHEALLQLPNNSVEPETILEVHQKGYTLGGKLLRPSRVIISSSGE